MIIIKYMGSKSRIAKHIVPIIQSYIDNASVKVYYEPFVGGANIIDKIKCNERIGSDLNKYLIALLKQVRDDKESLYKEVSKDLYDKVRTAYNNGNTSDFEDWEVGNVGFLASYNGRWFDGGYAKSGYEKTKTGQRYRDYYQESKNNIITQADNLKGIEFTVLNYLDTNKDLKGAVIYCDPPYANVKQYKNAMNFDYNKFWNWCRNMSKNNVVIISEQSAPDDFECIWQQEVSRSIKVQDKSKSIEKLFKYIGK